MSTKTNLILNGHDLTIEDVFAVARSSKGKIEITIDPQSLKKMQQSRDYVYDIVKKGAPVYGINTGFGALSNMHIADKDLSTLQINLIRSHCTGVGAPFSKEITRAIMLLRANCLVSGYSGVNPDIVQLIIDFLNHDITPIVPSKGSVGASGDLAPLSHIALCLIGEGMVEYDNKTINSSFAIKSINKVPAELGPKDGLALINGTAVMAALGAVAAYQAKKIMKLADIISCVTLDGLQGTYKAFDPLITSLKPHLGQEETTENINKIIEGSEIVKAHENCGKVQDPYSLRCIPQVHGACRQTLFHTWSVLSTELNAVTDNPLIFVDEDKVISGGNFHGEAIALAMDYLCMGLSEIASISERRVEKMMNPSFSELPAFLTKNSGLNSGLMIAHVTSAALASENKYLCHPASVDSIPTSTDKEDHVSMGVTSGRKLYEILDNVKNCLAIELLCSTQAIEFLRPLKSSPAVEEVFRLIRKHVEPIEEDRVFHHDIKKIFNLIDNGEILNAVEQAIGEIK